MVKKNKLVKNITIDKLAEIINDGFNGQMEYMEKKFEAIDKKFMQVDKKLENFVTKKEVGEIQKDVRYIKENLDDAGKLGKRVDYIETILDLPAIKK